MLYINPSAIPFKAARLAKMKKLSVALALAPPDQRDTLIEDGRAQSWGHKEIIKALRAVVGNKCWYSEVHLDGNDPNVDHFRPKGAIREIDNASLAHQAIGPSYWWLAFEARNYRLAAVHANQRRVDETTIGGKANYFPVRGPRAPERTAWLRIREDALPLDPCSKTDMALIWFDPDGNPCPAKLGGKPISVEDQERVRISIWLYHLNKDEIKKRRADHIRGILADLADANDEYEDWDRDGARDLKAKRRFDAKIDKIHKALDPKSIFAGAVNRVVRTSSANYTWISEYLL